MKLSTLGWCVAGWLALAPHARADELTVIEVSPADHAAADKLAELSRQAFTRQERAGLTLDEHPASLCTSQSEIILILDSAHDAVQLLRCHDGALLTRAIAPEAARETPYLAAFVAAELLDLNRELQDVRVEPLTAAERPPPPAAAPPSLTAAPAPSPPPPSADSATRLVLRLGAESLLAAAPFRALPRPTFAVGLSFPHGPAGFSWYGELQLSLLAHASRQRPGERLVLTRHDVRLRAGLVRAFGPLALAGLLNVRGSLTAADYSAQTETSKASFRLGVGAGLLASLELSSWALLYADASFDLATSRSQYQTLGNAWVKEPAFAVECSLGVMLRARL